MQCCPISGNDGDPASCYSEVIRRARKEHDCSECGEVIRPGEKYQHASGVWDGSPSSYKTCLLCVEIRDHFSCGGWIFGEFWNDLRENFFPDMKMGGPCMLGLSPAAKAKLVEWRLEWYLSHDEAPRDDVWDGWKPDVAPIRARPAFVPPAYAELEYEPCGGEWGCNVEMHLGYLRRGGLSKSGGEVVYRTVQEVERNIREAERYCRKIRPYAHQESIVPVDPKADLYE